MVGTGGDWWGLVGTGETASCDHPFNFVYISPSTYCVVHISGKSGLLFNIVKSNLILQKECPT